MNFQYNLFNEVSKTKNAEKHDRLRSKQSDYLDSHHHPQEKIQQLIKLDNYMLLILILMGIQVSLWTMFGTL
jgi:hypothetical protein